MKNFSDLLDTDCYLDIEVITANSHIRTQWQLLTPLNLIYQDATSVRIDGMEVLDFGYQKDGVWRLCHDEPFYRWRHRVTGQGWLLDPVS